MMRSTISPKLGFHDSILHRFQISANPRFLRTSNPRWFHISNTSREKLNIAFFGSDEFSIQSLQWLLEFKNQSRTDNKLSIGNIDLIVKHPKLSGRGMSSFSDVPIVKYLEQYNFNNKDHEIPIIRAESKQEINNLIPKSYDLAIAVSYGKLIPSDFIKSLKYCGLNVHPSLLPKYSGTSPLQYALLNDDEFTGVTVQTLHPTKFDRGEIVIQSKEMKISDDETLGSLREKLGEKGGELLSKVISDGMFKNLHGGEEVKDGKYQYSYASKITPDMKQVLWDQYGSRQLKRRINVLGSLYSYKKVDLKKKKNNSNGNKGPQFRRVIFYDIEPLDLKSEGLEHDGEFKLSKDGSKVLVKTIDGVISCGRLKFECFGEEDAATFMKRLKKRSGNDEQIFCKA
ncbi:methionyl-tRNA formyltransferase [Saccharomycopsis crataegensis]|uniref:methionyl-tRNA formyltransferase n=1 Tax=Saccharomycopsis crataegensis TaxID=43959 RepID=A0AAV5QUW6_9ASCO|nr:methionyl-tRNA formyltransferase [Saccharomycopsis crataegensis]